MNGSPIWTAVAGLAVVLLPVAVHQLKRASRRVDQILHDTTPAPGHQTTADPTRKDHRAA